MKLKLSIFILSIFSLGFAILPQVTVVHAQAQSADYQPLVTVTDPSGNPINTKSFSSYLQSIYTIGIGATFVIGVIIFIKAGFQKIGSESVFKKSEANTQMMNALIGLAIALASYILLQTINPDLLKFNISIPQAGSGSTAPSTTN